MYIGLAFFRGKGEPIVPCAGRWGPSNEAAADGSLPPNLDHKLKKTCDSAT